MDTSVLLSEYSCQIPANRIGFIGNGGPFSLMQLKIIQEVITLVVFTVFTTIFFKGETLQWNHLAAFVCLIAAVYFVFLK
ncbi:DMT family protein [Bacteroides thetaiotaomicron]|jgi:membrane protein|nr:DMT family protein [Bacteroides thetaiotaomicron]MCE8477004.1 DMT family protein [Bacteroides thetaiotaomicron]MCE9136270.1 DMT family protein [Bacteroides thetaiotaomicron]